MPKDVAKCDAPSSPHDAHPIYGGLKRDKKIPRRGCLYGAYIMLNTALTTRLQKYPPNMDVGISPFREFQNKVAPSGVPHTLDGVFCFLFPLSKFRAGNLSSLFCNLHGADM